MYTSQIGKDFWFDFDNQTLWQRSRVISESFQRAYFQHGFSLDSFPEFLRTSFNSPSHPDSFVGMVEPGKSGITDLAAIHLQLIDRHLRDDESIRRAFEDFGQGLLFDDRAPRPVGRHVHMMDGTPDTWVGWQRWHGFIRAAALLGSDTDRWLHIDRSMALAWAIQTEANPEIDNPNNPPLAEHRLAKLRNVWMSLNFDQLDWAFAKHRFRAPGLEALAAVLTRSDNLALVANVEQEFNYETVQQILEDASGSGQPYHGGAGRFWLLPEAEFLALPPVYGHQLIADPGPDRGARSALVKVLKGTLTGVPRMPLNEPPLSSDQIQYVESWIDSLDAESHQFRFAPPANVNDLGDELKSQWSDVVYGWFKAAEARLLETLAPQEVRLFNLVDTPDGSAGPRAEIPWNGFPRKYRLAIDNLETRWNTVEKVVNRDLTGRQAAYFRKLANGDFVRADNIFFRDQDEYCEWHSFRNSEGKLVKIVFTCENPEYWRFIANNDPDLLLSLYQDLSEGPVQMQDLMFNEDIFVPDDDGNAVNLNGQYNPYNKWNSTDGAIHLTHPANSLSAEVFLAADATILRSKGNVPVTSPSELVCCAAYGGPDRSSDPTIGAAVNGLVRQGLSVTIDDPVGLYLHSLDPTPFELPTGVTFDDCWKVIRGEQATNRILRAEFALPDGAELDSVLVGGEPLQFGAQVAEFVSVVIFGKGYDRENGTPVARSCIGHCCTNLSVPSLQTIQSIDTPCPDLAGPGLAAAVIESQAPLANLKGLTDLYTR